MNRLLPPWALLRLAFAGLLGVLTELAGVGLVATATWMIVRAAEQPPLAALTVAIAGVRAFALSRGGLRYAERLAGHDAVLRVLADLRTRVFASLAAGAPAGRTGDLLSRVVSDVDGVQDVVLRGALPALVAAVTGSVAVLGVAAVSPAAGAVLLAGLLVSGVALPLLGHTLSGSRSAAIAAARGDATAATVDVLHGAAELVAFGALPAALAAATGRTRRLGALEARAATVTAFVGGLASLTPAVTAVCVALAAGGRSAAVLALGALTVGEVVVPLAGAAVQQTQLRGGLTRVRELLTGAPPEPPAEADRTVHRGPVDLALRGVTAGYGDLPDVLVDVHLDLPAGTRVAVVGPSGAGKSTLLAVLAGRVTPRAGTLSGVPEGAEPWQVAGGVFADAHVFHATVRDNVLLGREGHDDAAVRDALTAAGLPEYVGRLDDLVGEDGGQLSGGQRQRLLLARALLDPPPVLLLDEPTEGLDPAAADAVLDTALHAAGERTVLVVTHRTAELTRFDRVLEVADGRLGQPSAATPA